MKKILIGLIALGLVCSIPKVSIADRPTDFYQTITKTLNTTDAQTDAELWDPDAGNRIVIQEILVSADATQTIFFEVLTTTKIDTLYLIAGVPVRLGGGEGPVRILATDEILTYTTSTSANTTVIVCGYEDSF